jgi:hypothetical protein
MPIPFSNRVRVPPDVLRSNLDGESVLLNLQTETYFGLDEVGTRMWDVLTRSESIQAAFEVLAGEYDVEPADLRRDLVDLLDKLTDQRLLEVHE